MKSKLFAMALILFLIICQSEFSEATETRAGFTIRVYNANLKHQKDKNSYAVRVENIAQLIAQKDNNRGQSAELFGLVEAFYKTEGTWTEHHKKKQIPCPQDGNTLKWTHNCFFDRWFASLNLALQGSDNRAIGPIGDQYGDVAILASRDLFEIEEGTDYFKGVIGPGGWGLLQYKIIGVRLRIKGTKWVLPFYVTHVVTEKGSDKRREQCVSDILAFVQSHWVEGDLTPIIVGDFNFGRSQPNLYNKMSERFREVGWTLLNYDDIEHIWIGKQESFPGSFGELRPVAYDEFLDGAVNLTDHNIPYADLALYPDTVTVGDFNGDNRTDVLSFYPGDLNWWLGSYLGTNFTWTWCGNTSMFCQIKDGRPFWSGRFSRSDRDEILFYYPGDDNWWLGSHDGSKLTWTLAGNTAGFGHGINDGRPFWSGRFSRADRDEILFYYPGDDNWWLGSHDGSSLVWSFAGNTSGFGHGINDGRPFWIGDFDGDGLSEILFYYPGHDNWWLGSHDGSKLVWTFAGNTSGFGHGINDGRPFWVGRFSRADRDEILFYYPGDDNWWLGSYDGSKLVWTSAGNTSGFGHGINDGRPFWSDHRFSRLERDEVLFYSLGDDNWWLGSHDGSKLSWSFAGNTANFGYNITFGRPFWISDFNGDGLSEILFLNPDDGHWLIGSYRAGSFSWSLAGSFK